MLQLASKCRRLICTSLPLGHCFIFQHKPEHLNDLQNGALFPSCHRIVAIPISKNIGEPWWAPEGQLLDGDLGACWSRWNYSRICREVGQGCQLTCKTKSVILCPVCLGWLAPSLASGIEDLNGSSNCEMAWGETSDREPRFRDVCTWVEDTKESASVLGRFPSLL